MSSTEGQRRWYRGLAYFASAFAILVIILGAFTRLVDAGLGCPDWPGCYGHLLWPNDADEIARANQAFPEAPVETDKTWPEMVHRYLATSLGLMAIGLVALAWRTRDDGLPFKLPLFLLGFVILQGMFGMWTVTLKLWPQVVTAHLLGGFATLSLLWLLSMRLGNWRWHLPLESLMAVSRLHRWAVVALLVVIAQVALGGWTTSNYAAVACPDLPGCQGQLWPEMDWGAGFNFTQAVGPNYLGGIMDNEARIAIHMAHRIGAVITTICLLLFAWKLWRLPFVGGRRMAVALVGVLGLQLLLGLGNIVLNFPLSVAVAHNAVGALLLATLVTINYRIFTATVVR